VTRLLSLQQIATCQSVGWHGTNLTLSTVYVSVLAPLMTLWIGSTGVLPGQFFFFPRACNSLFSGDPLNQTAFSPPGCFPKDSAFTSSCCERLREHTPGYVLLSSAPSPQTLLDGTNSLCDRITVFRKTPCLLLQFQSFPTFVTWFLIQVLDYPPPSKPHHPVFQ